MVLYICTLNDTKVKPMKSYFYLTLLILFSFACSPEEDGPTIEEVQGNITIGIVSPVKTRDYSYHNNGVQGVYEIPSTQKSFTGKIEFLETANVSPNQLIVKWISDIDGELFVEHPNNNWESTFTTTLSKGLHTISFEVYLGNNAELLQKDTIIISNVIELEATPHLGRIMKLNWTKYEGSDFVSYLVYHDDNNPIAEITDSNTLQYDYPDTHSLTDPHPYQIVVKTSNPNWSNQTLGSNIVTKKTGDFLSIPYYIKKMVKDPVRNRLYAICTPNDLDEIPDKYGVIVINTDTFTVQDHILTTTRFTDLSVAPDGQFMYLTQRHVDKITKVNLNTFASNTITTYTGGNGFNNIEAGNNNLLYANVHQNSENFQLINALNGSYTEALNSFYLGDMRYNSANDNLYYGELTSSGQIFKLNPSNIATGTYLTLPQFPAFPGGVTYPYPLVTVSDDGNHIFWDEYHLGPNLNVIRSFNEIYIHACSPSNQYLSDLNKLYDFNTMAVILNYPSFGNYEYYDSDIYFTDENTIYTNKSYDSNDGNASYSYIFRIKIN